MGRRIVAVKNREEDFLKMDSLFYLADQHGLRVMAFHTENPYFVEYLRPNMHKEPLRQECRDEQDYEYMLDAWIRNCTVRSPKYNKFQSMVLGEIERLKELPL